MAIKLFDNEYCSVKSRSGYKVSGKRCTILPFWVYLLTLNRFNLFGPDTRVDIIIFICSNTDIIINL